MYLEPIFTSDDITKQLPVESKKYKSMERTWKRVMRNALDIPNVSGNIKHNRWGSIVNFNSFLCHLIVLFRFGDILSHKSLLIFIFSHPVTGIGIFFEGTKHGEQKAFGQHQFFNSSFNSKSKKLQKNRRKSPYFPTC